MVSLRAVMDRVQPAGFVPAEGMSLLRHLFGYIPLPIETTSRFVQVSVHDQLDRLRRIHFNINVISVAFDALPVRTEATAQGQLNSALVRAREIYDAAGVGIGRVLRFSVPSQTGPGGDGHLRSEQELKDLTNAWTVHHDGIDVFVVSELDYMVDGAYPGGHSPIGGTCNKDDDTVATGLGIVLDSTPAATGHTLGHELGHYLGLEHWAHAGDNLMVPGSGADTLQNSQIQIIRGHCSIRAPLPI